MCEEQVLAVTRRLGGEAGVADIYHATFNGAPAAVKVLHIRESQEEPLAHATQMAVLSAVPHPAIVQAFAMWPDMALTEDDTSSSSPSRGAGSCASAGPPAAAGAAPRRLRLRSLLPGEAAGAGATPVNVILLELCDRGTLWDALATGALVTPAGDCGSDDGCGGAPDCGAGGGRACAAAGLPPGVTAVLCDVAAALQFLHSKQLAHGNVRSDNVLLKTEPARHLGVQAKLAGFGRARVLGQHGHATSAALAARACGGCGRPPPRVAKGSFRRLSWMSDAGSCRSSPTGGAAAMADDVYAFGALLLEALDTAGAKARAPGAPPCGFRALAAECLSEDAARRPSMAAALARLNLVAAAHAPQRGPCAAAGVGAHGRFVWCEAPAPPITWPDVA
ncbi:MAG: kinase-like domain-containing protein [Monoraphidium minutum]|nr:MAG: kinase-like domain-containing protein [Monoraphidium minutum]